MGTRGGHRFNWLEHKRPVGLVVVLQVGLFLLTARHRLRGLKVEAVVLAQRQFNGTRLGAGAAAAVVRPRGLVMWLLLLLRLLANVV